MSQIRFVKSRSVAAAVGVATLVAALALVAGPASGQQSPTSPPPAPKAPGSEDKRPAAAPSRPAPPVPEHVIPKPPDATAATPTPVSTLVLGEALSGFIIFMFIAGWVTLLAVGARYY